MLHTSLLSKNGKKHETESCNFYLIPLSFQTKLEVGFKRKQKQNNVDELTAK